MLYDIFKSQIESRGSSTEKAQDFMLEFLKNENVFVAQKQEETKYHLTLSRAVCTLRKMERKNEETQDDSARSPFSPSPSPLEQFPTYEEFSTNFVACSDEEYTEIQEKFQQFPSEG